MQVQGGVWELIYRTQKPNNTNIQVIHSWKTESVHMCIKKTNCVIKDSKQSNHYLLEILTVALLSIYTANIQKEPLIQCKQRRRQMPICMRCILAV